MIMELTTLIKEREEALPLLAAVNYNMYFGSPAVRRDTGDNWTFEQAEDELKSFHRDTIRLTLEAVIEMCEGMIWKKENGWSDVAQGHNNALTDLSSKIDEALGRMV